MKVLVTGGAGYIGTHTCVELLDAGHEIIVVDNFSNSSPDALERVEKITGSSITFIEADIRDTEKMNNIFGAESVDAVIHFAGLKAVGESVDKPLEYYNNNITGTLSLLQAMVDNGVKNIVFSSSATVYGDPDSLPIREDFPLSATNPYGRSKLIIEEMLRDLHRAADDWNMVILRYFNPVGAHQSGLIGEDPNDIPNNLVPYISQVAIGKLKELAIYGNDYATKDGTGVRDYIHVMDLAKGHVQALKKLESKPGCLTCNLGTGIGYSVLEMVHAFEQASQKRVPYRFDPRRSGDIAACYADPSFAEKELGWKAELD